MTALARALDAGAACLAAALLASLLFWTGRPDMWWFRPETVFLVLLGVVALRLLAAPAALPVVEPRRAVAAGIAAYAALFSFVTLSRHFTLATHALDLGYYVQLTWNLARGHGPYVSLPAMHAWGDHLSPIMYLFVPAFWIAPGPEVLLVAQSVLLALGALPVFGLARRRLGEAGPAAAFALLYLANPSLHGINVRDFHAAALAIPLILAAAHFAEARRHGLFAAAAALALTAREDAALAVLGLGVWLALGRRRWLLGAATAGAALAALAVEVRWIIPYFRGAPYAHLGRYAHLGGSLGEIAAHLALHPVSALAGLMTGDRLVYLGAMLAPLAFLPLLAPAELAGAVPALAQNLLSSDPVLYHFRAQYQAFVLPFLVLAAIAGYAQLRAGRRRRWGVGVLMAAALVSLALASRTVNNLALARWWPTHEHRAAHAVMAAVPPGAALTADERYVPHLSLRPLVFVFPAGIERADHVLINAAAYPWRNLPGVTMEREGGAVVITLPGRREYRYAVVREAGPHLLLRRL